MLLYQYYYHLYLKQLPSLFKLNVVQESKFFIWLLPELSRVFNFRDCLVAIIVECYALCVTGASHLNTKRSFVMQFVEKMGGETDLPSALYSSTLKLLEAFRIFMLFCRSDHSEKGVLLSRQQPMYRDCALLSPGCCSTRMLISAAVARYCQRRPLTMGSAHNDDFIPWPIHQTKCNNRNNPLV